MPSEINAETASFCFLDLDLNQHRSKLATTAAFVDATDSRYGFSSKDIRQLGGSEISRIPDLMACDHEWSSRAAQGGVVEIRPPAAGNRIVVKLFWDVAPLACENFATLCANGSLLPWERKVKPAPIGESGKPMTYRESTVHRVIPGFIMQGGDFVFGNGSGGESIFGKKFKDERAGLALKHDRRGILSMGNSGKNSNTSQFFITFQPAPQCDGKHVIFGKVVSGFEVLEAVEAVGTAGGEPKASITITDCGLWTPLQSAGAGYWLDLPDAESYSGVSSLFIVRPRVAVVAPNSTVFERFRKACVGCVTSFLEVKDDESSTAKEVNELLDGFAVDVVLVAPLCKSILSLIKLPSVQPSSWDTTSISTVAMECKPADALSVIQTLSWISQRSWHLDGFVN